MKFMAAFRIVPVLDVKNGVAVHAVKGQRDAYVPVSCAWCKDGNVHDLVKGYHDIFSLNDLYVADLDAITRGTFTTNLYPDLVAMVPGKIMIDAGITSAAAFHAIKGFNFAEIIMGTESVATFSVFKQAIKINRGATIISLDVKDGHVMSPITSLANASVRDAFHTIEALSPGAVIYLDLSGVGAKRGVNPGAMDLAREATVSLYLGGGVKSAADLHDARDAGFRGVLLATALQERLINPSEIQDFADNP